MTDREIPITLEEYLKIPVVDVHDGPDTYPTTRVVFVEEKEEFLRVYLVMRSYGTHHETWLIAETDLITKRPYMRHNFLQDREGKWVSVYHFFHHTREDMLEWLVETDKSYSEFGLYNIRHVRL